MDITIAEDGWTNRTDHSIRDLEHQHWHVGESDDSFGHTTENQSRDATAPMRGYHN